jgi:hypothetical protein
MPLATEFGNPNLNLGLPSTRLMKTGTLLVLYKPSGLDESEDFPWRTISRPPSPKRVRAKGP